MKYILILSITIILSACNNKQEQKNSKNINEVINELEKVHPYNLSPDKSWMIDLNYENEFLKSYTIIHQGGEELTTQMDFSDNFTIINKPKSVDYSWVEDQDLGSGFKISSIGFTKTDEISLVIFKEGVGQYSAYPLEEKN